MNMQLFTVQLESRNLLVILEKIVKQLQHYLLKFDGQIFKQESFNESQSIVLLYEKQLSLYVFSINHLVKRDKNGIFHSGIFLLLELLSEIQRTSSLSKLLNINITPSHILQHQTCLYPHCRFRVRENNRQDLDHSSGEAKVHRISIDCE